MSEFVVGSLFSEPQRATLAAICDTLIARLDDEEIAGMRKQFPDRDSDHFQAYCRSNGSDLGLPGVVEETMAKNFHPDQQRETGILLSAMGSRIGMFGLCGYFSPFVSLSHQDRVAALNNLQNSSLEVKRKSFAALKVLIGARAFNLNSAEVNPNNHGKEENSFWKALDYPGPSPVGEVHQITATTGRDEMIYSMLNEKITKDTSMTVDVVIVGSGCGGSVAAAALAKAGAQVLVVEKGTYYKRDDFTGVEGDAFDMQYERGGVVFTEDTGIGVLAGSTFGGGTAVNWACCLRTPDNVKQEWADEHGLNSMIDGSFDAALDAVCSRMGVHFDGIVHNRANQLVQEGCERLGYECVTAGQNMKDVAPYAPGAGFISIGDRHGIKNSTTETWLRDAATASTPALFADRCTIDRVTHEKGAASGVVGRIVGADGKVYKFRVAAPIVIVSCGSINSPALLLRSKLPNRNGQIGKNLRLHPVSGVVGFVPDDAPDVSCWEGAPMTAICNVPGPTKPNYGSRLEVPSTHPGLMSSSVPWVNGRGFKENVLMYKRAMVIITLTRDQQGGEVKLDKHGSARLYYKLGQEDNASMMEGVVKSVRVAASAGCKSISSGHFSTPQELPSESDPEAREAEVERIIRDIRRIGFPYYKVPLFSAHQMGTCKMGSDPKSSVVKPTGESWECSGLYVMDASVFPTSSGTNPMVTNLAMTQMVSQRLANSLASKGIGRGRAVQQSKL